MLKTHLPSTKKFLFAVLTGLACMANYAFNSTDATGQEWLNWSNRCLAQSFEVLPSDKIKKWELTLTPDAFMRLRKTYVNGKQEYYSFHMHRFKDMDYLGTTEFGILNLRTNDTDIIVQTYNDRKGNVDSMASVLSIPVKNMGPERLDSLRTALFFFKKKGL